VESEHLLVIDYPAGDIDLTALFAADQAPLS